MPHHESFPAMRYWYFLGLFMAFAFGVFAGSVWYGFNAQHNIQQEAIKRGYGCYVPTGKKHRMRFKWIEPKSTFAP